MVARKKRSTFRKAPHGKINASDIVAELRERIATRALPPGAPLREESLAAEFGVNRIKIRDVLSALEQLELINRTPKIGATVAMLTFEQVVEIYEIREVLEGLSARLAVEKTAPGTWEPFVEQFEKAAKAYAERQDIAPYIKAIDSLRATMVRVAQNVLLSKMLGLVFDRSRALIRRVALLPGRPEQGLKEHKALVEAMRRGDAREAEALARTNIRNAKEFILRYRAFLFDEGSI